jgi:hypothetical protein
VVNIGERMVTDPIFDVETYFGNLSASVFAVELHWCAHLQGAIEIARLCKLLHLEAVTSMDNKIPLIR